MEYKLSRACSLHGENRNAQKVLVEMPEGKRPVERLGHRRKIL
jgi:hypothetical protein